MVTSTLPCNFHSVHPTAGKRGRACKRRLADSNKHVSPSLCTASFSC